MSNNVKGRTFSFGEMEEILATRILGVAREHYDSKTLFMSTLRGLLQICVSFKNEHTEFKEVFDKIDKTTEVRDLEESDKQKLWNVIGRYIAKSKKNFGKYFRQDLEYFIANCVLIRQEPKFEVPSNSLSATQQSYYGSLSGEIDKPNFYGKYIINNQEKYNEDSLESHKEYLITEVLKLFMSEYLSYAEYIESPDGVSYCTAQKILDKATLRSYLKIVDDGKKQSIPMSETAFSLADVDPKVEAKVKAAPDVVDVLWEPIKERLTAFCKAWYIPMHIDEQGNKLTVGMTTKPEESSNFDFTRRENMAAFAKEMTKQNELMIARNKFMRSLLLSGPTGGYVQTILGPIKQAVAAKEVELASSALEIRSDDYFVDLSFDVPDRYDYVEMRQRDYYIKFFACIPGAGKVTFSEEFKKYPNKSKCRTSFSYTISVKGVNLTSIKNLILSEENELYQYNRVNRIEENGKRMFLKPLNKEREN